MKSLEKAGIRGVTIYEVKGLGEQASLFNPYAIHNKIDVFSSDSKVDEICGIILGHASTGLAGGGLLVV